MECSRRSLAGVAMLCTVALPMFAARLQITRVPTILVAAGGGLHGGGQGFLGVATRNLSDPALAALHLKETHGACVVMVDHDSPAWKAGIREHDVLTNLNGAPIDSEEQLARLLRDIPPGRSVQIVLSRDGMQQTLNAVVADRDEVGKLAWEQHFVVPAPSDSMESMPSVPPVRARSSTFGHNFVGSHLLPGGSAYTGAMVDEIGPQLAEYFGLKSGKGLLVHSVDPNSPAADAGLHAGDVVCKINGQPMSTRGDWAHALHDSKGHPVSVTVMRERHEQILTIVPDGKRRSDAEQPGESEHHWLAVLLVHPHGL